MPFHFFSERFSWQRMVPVSIDAICVWALVVSLSVPTSAATTFVDVKSSAGIQHSQNATFHDPLQPKYRMTGGAAAGDFDGDGWVDLYFTRFDDTDVLYRNLGNGTFQDVTSSVFGSGHLSDVNTNGAVWGDVDNDNDLDLYVTSFFSNRYHLFINDGNGGFAEDAVVRGAAVQGSDTHLGFSPTFGDYDSDGYLDLYVTEWRLKTDNSGGAVQNSRLLRNLGASQPGHFVDVTQAAGVAMDSVIPSNLAFDSQTFTARFTDLDADGHPDLAIASDHHTSRLFWNNGDGTFTDGTASAGVGTDEFGMGSTVGDYDGDGDLDWFVTSIYEDGDPLRDGNRLYRNDGNRTFADATDAAGVRNGAWGWGAAWFDYDNDGDLDLVEANGQDFSDTAAAGSSVGFDNNPVKFWENDGTGVYTEKASTVGLTDTGSGKGLVTFDYDQDGDLDVLIVNNGAAPVLYRNDGGNANVWLIVDLSGSFSSSQGIGALVTVDPNESISGDEITREVDAGSHFLGQSESIAHFGLGTLSGTIDRVSIQWPSGQVSEHMDVATGQRLILDEPVSTADYDGDGDVDGVDFLDWQRHYGEVTAAAFTGGDYDGDSDVDQGDLKNWVVQYGTLVPVGAATTVPEPSSLTISLWLLARSVRRRTYKEK